MDLTFANPAGWYALLGIPAVLAIHFLQRQTRKVIVAAYFLIEKTAPESLAGPRWERLRSSIPLWLQLLAVLLLTWLLLQPRWPRPDSVQRIILVVDNSASMQASRDRLLAALPSILANIASKAARTDWLLLESDLRRGGALYEGPSHPELLARLSESWRPARGTHDPAPAFRLAQSLLHGEGALIYLTDHPEDPANPTPAGVTLLSFGQSAPNVGFAGLVIRPDPANPAVTQWEALIVNHSDTQQTRNWSIVAPGQPPLPPGDPALHSVTLQPDETLTLRGPLPDQLDRAELRLDPDALAADDRLPLVRPLPKPIRLATPPAGSPHSFLWDKLLPTLAPTLPANATAPADLTLLSFNPLNPGLPTGEAILFILEPGAPGKLRDGPLVPEPHPLMDGLNWQALQVRRTLSLSRTPADQVLLWQGRDPLILLRIAPGAHHQLILNFDPTHSNAERVPALPVLIRRFTEDLRARLVAPESRNTECSQSLDLAAAPVPPAPALRLRLTPLDPALPPLIREITPSELPVLRAPDTPAFFDILQNNPAEDASPAAIPLLRSAAHFADIREADLRPCAPADTTPALAAHLTPSIETTENYVTPLLLLLALLLLANWAYVATPRRPLQIAA